MPRPPLLEWEGKEYDREPKSADWYVALGIIAAAGTIALILFGEYLLAVLVVVAATVIAIHTAKHPPTHRFQLVENGIRIGEEFHPFDKMISFSILEDIEGELPPLLSVKNETWLSPHLVIPLEGVDADQVYLHFLKNVDEQEHRHAFSDLVAAWLGF